MVSSKARQLSVLCDASVALLVVSASGKLYSFSSGDKVIEIIGSLGFCMLCNALPGDLYNWYGANAE